MIGREVIEVLGRDVYQLYHAYIDAALAGERTGFERQLVAPGRPPIWIRVDYYPDRDARRATSAASSSPTATSTT